MTWVVGLDSNFFWGCFWTLTFFGESAAECEYAANSGLFLANLLLNVNMLPTLDSNFFRENLLEKN